MNFHFTADKSSMHLLLGSGFHAFVKLWILADQFYLGVLMRQTPESMLRRSNLCQLKALLQHGRHLINLTHLITKSNKIKPLNNLKI